MIIHYKELDGGNLMINDGFADLLAANGISSAKILWDFSSENVKNVVKERGTARCFLKDSSGHNIECYIKRYSPIPLREKLKNILSLKPYNFDAIHEWNSLGRFLELGLNTMVPMAAARLDDGRSCNLTLGITDYVRASELFAGFSKGEEERRMRLVGKIAQMVGKMHAAGMAHQDLYLVHFFIKPEEGDNVFLIDLQRMISQPKLAKRWQVKDLGQLLFSAEKHITPADLRFFWEIYTEQTGIEPNDITLQKAIRAKAARIHRHDENRRKRNSKGK